jgi:hypothetical protein
MTDLIEQTIPRIITGCSLTAPDEKVCDAEAVAESVKIVGASTLEEAIKATSCGTIKCLVSEAATRGGSAHLRESVQRHFKLAGPTDVRLLSNNDIDNILAQWMAARPDFYAWKFNMLNFKEQSFRNGRVYNEPDTLATVRLEHLVDKYSCAACVINTDVYSGGGKHWMALYVDWRCDFRLDPRVRASSSDVASPSDGASVADNNDPHEKSTNLSSRRNEVGSPPSGSRPITIEFFNSSGNPPKQEYLDWMKTTAADAVKLGFTPAVIKVSDVRHQLTKSECGVYSLLYIWSRLNGISYEAFRGRRVPDEIMFQFRQHLYDGGGYKTGEGAPFSVEDFKRKVAIRWE